MRHSSIVAAGSLAVLVAIGSYGSAGCGLFDSGCGDAHDSVKTGTILLPSQSLQLVDNACSTCGHESLQVTWGIGHPAVITGQVQVEADGSCNGMAAEPYVVQFDAAAKVVFAEPPSLKSLCGDNAAAVWSVTLTNNGSNYLTDPTIRLFCPTFKETTPTLVSPSRLGIRGAGR